MIALQDLNNAYINLYKQLRNYIWSLSTVEHIAEFEVSVYSRFPDVDDIKNKFNKLKYDISASEVYRDDKDLKDSMSEFEDLINSIDIIYSPLQSLTPVYEESDQPIINTKEEVSDGDQGNEDKEASSEGQQTSGKKLFNIEHISKSSVD